MTLSSPNSWPALPLRKPYVVAADAFAELLAFSMQSPKDKGAHERSHIFLHLHRTAQALACAHQISFQLQAIESANQWRWKAYAVDEDQAIHPDTLSSIESTLNLSGAPWGCSSEAAHLLDEQGGRIAFGSQWPTHQAIRALGAWWRGQQAEQPSQRLRFRQT